MKSSPMILIIEDDGGIRGSMAAYLEDRGYTIIEAGDGREGLLRLREHQPDLVLVDIMMPEMNGLEVLAAAREEVPETPLIMVSGAGSVSHVVEALRLGAADFVTKPIVDLDILLHSVEKGLERAALLHQKRRYQEQLEAEVARRTADLERELAQRRLAEGKVRDSLVKLEEVLDETVHTLATMVEIKDPYTSGHQRRVSRLGSAIAMGMGFPSQQIKGIRVACLLHDIGKICVPAEILSRPGQLTGPELELLKTHASVGYQLLFGIPFEWPVAQIVLQHHERIDGSGYPQGLTGERILPEARILAVADVVDALSSHRPYRPAIAIDKVLDEVLSQRGVLYDAEAVETCVVLFKKRGFDPASPEAIG